METNEQPASTLGEPASALDKSAAPELTAQVQQLVNEALNDGPEKAIAKARETGNDALLDALHAALSEPATHAKLVKRGKVAPAA